MQIISLFRHAEDAQPVSAGQVIFEQGEPGETMYVVIEGQVDLIVHGKVVETVTPGGIMGEMALIDKSPRSARAIARSDSKIVPIDKRRFTFLVQQTPNFALEVMSIMANRLRHMNQLVD